jgi:hypothetical protein
MWYAVKSINRMLVHADTAQDAARIARNNPQVLSILTVTRADIDDRHQVVDLHPAKSEADNEALRL